MALFSELSKTRKIKGFKLFKFGYELFKNSVYYSSYRYFGFPKILPKIVRVSITNKCDSRCRTCGVWSYYHKHPKKEKDEITFEEFKKFVDSNPFLEDIGLTGGQVTLRDDIVDMWLYLDKKGYRTGGATNAVNLKKVISVQEEVLKKLSGKHTHLILLSIDGIGEYHDKVRGIKGEFDNSIKLLKWALSKQSKYTFLDVGIAHTITKENYMGFPEFVDYMLSLGIRPSQISYRPAIFSGRFYNINSKEILTKAETKQVIKILERVKRKYKECDNYSMNGMIKYLKNPRKLVIPCYAGYSAFFVDPYCDVYACLDSTTLMGNLRKTQFRLRPIWDSKRAKQVQKNVKKGICHNCWNPCFSGPSMISNPFKILKLVYGNFHKLLMK